MTQYEAAPMRGIEYAPHDGRAWMVVSVLTDEERRIDVSPKIICWSYQGTPEANEANARMVVAALNEVTE